MGSQDSPFEERYAMRTNRLHVLSKLMTLALVAVVAAACSSTSSADASVFDQARDLGQDLNRAVSATQDAVTGYAEPQFAARAIDRAATTSRRLAETATNVRSQELRSATSELVSVANRIVTQLAQGEVESAESLRANSFVPLASQIAQLKGSLPATSQTPDSSGGQAIAAAFGLIVLVVGAVAALLVRGRKRPVEAGTKSGESRTTTPTSTNQGPERNWNQPHPLYPGQSRSEPSVSANADIARTTRMRPIDIELRSLLEATIDQAREREWFVSLVCPEVHISGDPVRVQRAILATLGNAFLEGAELVGIVVDVVDGRVLLSIGHDAAIDDQKAKNIAERLAGQLSSALDESELGWSVAADGEIYLTTVSAGAAKDIEAGAEVSV